MANTFRKVYKKTGNSGTSSDYQLVGNIGVNGVELDIMKGATSSADGEIGLVPKPTSSDIKMVLKYGIDEYIDTTIKKDTELRDALVGLTSNMQDVKTMNMTLNDKHYKFMKELNELSLMLNQSIKLKEDVKDKNKIEKTYTVLVDETKQTNKMNKQIAKINYLYREINSFKN